MQCADGWRNSKAAARFLRSVQVLRCSTVSEVGRVSVAQHSWKVTTAVHVIGEIERKMTTPVSGGFTWTEGAAGRVLQLPVLGSLAPHVFTTRDLSFRGEHEAADYRRLSRALGVRDADIVRVKQVHGRAITMVHVGEALPA